MCLVGPTQTESFWQAPISREEQEREREKENLETMLAG